MQEQMKMKQCNICLEGKPTKKTRSTKELETNTERKWH